MEAQPTTYRRVLLRSKSEAVFIRGIELSGIKHWEYEPDRFKVDDWTPDFWIVDSFFSKKVKKFLIMSVVVEYKPCPITDSYRTQLETRFRDLLMRSIEDTIIPVLVIGNAYDLSIKRTVEAFDGTKWELIGLFDFRFFKHIDEAKSYRFDLDNGL